MVAQGPEAGALLAFFDSPFLGPGLMLAGALLAGAFAIALLRRWQRATASPIEEASDQLSHYRALYEKGAISDAEYQGLRRALSRELAQGADPAAPGAPPPGPEPGPAEGPGPAPSTGIRPS